jgi:hypothetical protein
MAGIRPFMLLKILQNHRICHVLNWLAKKSGRVLYNLGFSVSQRKRDRGREADVLRDGEGVEA